jgi:hypothetical protein
LEKRASWRTGDVVERWSRASDVAPGGEGG